MDRCGRGGRAGGDDRASDSNAFCDFCETVGGMGEKVGEEGTGALGSGLKTTVGESGRRGEDAREDGWDDLDGRVA